MIKSPRAQRDKITVNRRILWEILDTDKRRLLQLIPREKIAEILRAIHKHQKEVLLGLAKALVKVELTAVEARLNGVEFAEPADQDGSLHQKNSETQLLILFQNIDSVVIFESEAKWLQRSSPEGDARFVRDTAAEGPEPQWMTGIGGGTLAFYLAQLLVLVFIRCQKNKRERGQKVIAGAKKVAFTLKLRLIHQPRQTVRYKLINKSHSRTFCLSWSVFLELESPLTSMPTDHCLSIRSCSQELSEQIL
ncbi:hypothetical protein T12_1339 [Trichinella patagoniensis]|uniref:Uncharacterized protein n=1 Tax=Trichinella patagoniensis TaxID=990121 RepID=A0A0V0ZJZ4_9BILA|nr:hypothetical protein T12_1339 [Trichinella patagoniensis]